MKHYFISSKVSIILICRQTKVVQVTGLVVQIFRTVTLIQEVESS